MPFPFHPKPTGTFLTLLLVNALGAELDHVCSSSWNSCKLSTWLGTARRLGEMITSRQSPWNIPGFLQAQPNVGFRMLNRLPLQPSHLHSCTPRELLVNMHTSGSRTQQPSRGSLRAKSFQGTLFQKGKDLISLRAGVELQRAQRGFAQGCVGVWSLAVPEAVVGLP